MLHDSIMSLVVVAVIIGLACVWYFTAGDTEQGEGHGILGPWYTDEADPGTIQFVPRPDWFFYFLFYLLRIFKWPETVVLGTVGVPTHPADPSDRAAVLRPPPRAADRPAAGGADRGDPRRHLDGRPDVEGRRRAKEALGSELIAPGTVEQWAKEQGFADERAGGGRRDAVRAVGLPQLPHVPR